MKQSQFFYKTQKDLPKDEPSVNAQLLIRGGFIDKLSAGVYSYLPLGLRVMTKIENIIREELQKISAQEILMPAMHPKENWVITGRWDTMTDLYKVKEGDKEIALGSTHEEVVVPLAKKYIQSFQDLPVTQESEYSLSLFQFQTKFRKELRAKSGLLRGREFMMKDLYSFHRNEQDLNTFYNEVENAYKNIFQRLEIWDKIYYTYASGGTFSEYSHEYQLLTSAGEDTIYVCQKCLAQDVRTAINKEIKEKTPKCPKCGSDDFTEAKAIEVANIFKLMTKFSGPFDLTYTDSDGSKQPVIMGCYGMGLGRIMGAIAEVYNDENGIIWPKEIAPFDIHLISIQGKEGQEVNDKADQIYQQISQNSNFSVLYDNRQETAGKKFADSDLIGIPLRVVVSSRSLESQSVEVKQRDQSQGELIKIEDFCNKYCRK